jgi:hypothetical protein
LRAIGITLATHVRAAVSLMTATFGRLVVAFVGTCTPPMRAAAPPLAALVVA